MEVTLQHAITYTTRGDVPVSVVAKTLLGNDRLIRESIKLMQAMVPNIGVSEIRIKVNQLSNASPLKAVFAVALVNTGSPVFAISTMDAGGTISRAP